MAKLSISALARYLLLALLTLSLVGCGGGSSDKGDPGTEPPPSDGDPNGDGDIQLSEEERVIGAAVIGFHQASIAASTAQSAATTPADPPNGSPPPAGAGKTLATGEVGTMMDCSSGDGEGAIRIAEGGEQLERQAITFPESHFSGSFPEHGTADDHVGRADCVMHQDGDTVYHYEMAFDVAQEENIDGQPGRRAVFARSGAFTGPNFEDAPDPEESGMANFTAAGMDMTLSSRFLIHACEGCVGGDLNDFSGDPERDTTSVSFLAMDMDHPGVRISMQLGEGTDALFAMVTRAAGNGATEVSMDGLMRYTDHSTGCAFDVTYATNADLVIADYSSDSPTMLGGQLQVTDNQSGNVYDVEYHDNGEVTVSRDGTLITIEPSEEAMACGFVAPDGDQGGSNGTPSDPDELTGHWVSDCEQIGESEWGNMEFDFAADGSATSIVNVFDNDSCSGTAEQTMQAELTYEIGDPIPQSGNTDAFEINLTDRVDPESWNDLPTIYEIYGIDGNRLYFGEPLAGPDQPEYRPEELDQSFGYTRQ
jgi:hypothetical protein